MVLQAAAADARSKETSFTAAQILAGMSSTNMLVEAGRGGAEHRRM